MVRLDPQRSLLTLRLLSLRFLQQHRTLLTKLAASAALGGLVLWNWKLMLALGVGVGAMVLVHTLQRLDWQQWLDKLRPWFTGPQKLLLLSVGTGSFAMLGTYMAASIWESDHSPWLASSLLLQGTGMMLTLALLTLQLSRSEGDRLHLSFDQTLDNLAHAEPLKRLLAVRQLQQLRSSGQLTDEQQHIAEQGLQLLLVQEREAPVREALLRSLKPQLKSQLKPLNLGSQLSSPKPEMGSSAI